jgi:hypothetical protein
VSSGFERIHNNAPLNPKQLLTPVRALSTMSRGIGTGPGVYYDGYSFQGEGVAKDPRHTHQAIWPKFRSASEDLRKDRGFGDPPPLPGKKRNGGGKPGPSAGKDAAMPMDPVARGLKPAAKGGKGGDEPR